FLNATGEQDMNMALAANPGSNMWTEIDLEGVPLWWITIWEINDRLYEGDHDVVAEVVGHHEAIRIPDGRTIMLAEYAEIDRSKEMECYHGVLDWYRILTTQYDTPLPLDRVQKVPQSNYDMVLEFAKDRSLSHVWKSSENIYITQEEQDEYSYNVLYFNLLMLALEPIYYGDSTNDRTHSNAFFYDPTDDNLFISVRSQDRVYKLNWSGYHDEAQAVDRAPGEVIYNLRDFAIFDTDYNPITLDYDNGVSFFSHQHCVEMYAVEGRPDLKLMTLFDNNNTPVMRNGNDYHSKALAAIVNEARQEVVILFHRELPNFCFALGTSQVLENGNFWYTCGTHDSKLGRSAIFGSHTTGYELSPDGDIIYSVGGYATTYRAWRLRSLYGAVDYMPVKHKPLPIPAAWDV
ncbi:arylsulfotransferase, partial [Kipferlia bialata]